MKHTDPSDFGKKVRVYRNLHKNCWSILHKGRVIGHADSVELKDVNLVVLRGGFERFQREQVKNVHAFVQGILVGVNQEYPKITGIRITYSPKRGVPLFRLFKEGQEGDMEQHYLQQEETFNNAFCGNKIVMVDFESNSSYL